MLKSERREYEREINYGTVWIYQDKLLIFIPSSRNYLKTEYLERFFPKCEIVGRCRLDKFRNRDRKWMSTFLQEALAYCQRMVWLGKYRMEFLDGEYYDQEKEHVL